MGGVDVSERSFEGAEMKLTLSAAELGVARPTRNRCVTVTVL